MNQDILFKAKSATTGEWVESMTISKGTIKRKAHDLFMEVSENKWVGIKKETLSVFTGKIISGVKIFTNDIIKCKFSKNEQIGRLSFAGINLPEHMYGLVVFDEISMGYKLIFSQPNPYRIVSCDFGWHSEEFEPCGSKFDNNDLLTSFKTCH